MRSRTATSRSAAGRTSSSALLASAGVKKRSGTAPPYRRDDDRRLALWLALSSHSTALGYGTRASSGKPDPQILYEWSTAIGGLVQDAILLVIVLAIAGFAPGSLRCAGPTRSGWPRG